jgi:hypothetical protein
MNEHQRCWWQQACSDHAVFLLLRQNSAAPCHQLHYLQMVTEKLTKAYIWKSGAAPKKSHSGLGLFMRLLLQVSRPRRQQLAELLGFARFDDFQNWTRQALPLAYALEQLAPDLANNGPNPEYPWPHEAPQFVPASFDFDVWRDLTKTGRGRQLTQVIKTCVEQFPALT